MSESPSGPSGYIQETGPPLGPVFNVPVDTFLRYLNELEALDDDRLTRLERVTPAMVAERGQRQADAMTNGLDLEGVRATRLRVGLDVETLRAKLDVQLASQADSGPDSAQRLRLLRLRVDKVVAIEDALIMIMLGYTGSEPSVQAPRVDPSDEPSTDARLLVLGVQNSHSRFLAVHLALETILRFKLDGAASSAEMIEWLDSMIKDTEDYFVFVSGVKVPINKIKSLPTTGAHLLTDVKKKLGIRLPQSKGHGKEHADALRAGLKKYFEDHALDVSLPAPS